MEIFQSIPVEDLVLGESLIEMDTIQKKEHPSPSSNQLPNEEEPPKEKTEEVQEHVEKGKNINPLLPFTKLLEERGLVSLEEGEEVSTIDDLESLLNKTIRSRELAQLTDKQKQILEWVEGGVPDDMIVQHESFTRNLDTITDEFLEEEGEEAEAVRKDLISKWYELKGFSQQKIARDLKAIFERGADAEEAKEAKREIAEIEKNNFQKQAQEYQSIKKKQQEAAQEDLKKLNAFLTVKEIIPGKPISKKEKDELYDSLTKPVSTKEFYDASGKPYQKSLNGIEDFLLNSTVEQKAALMYYIKITDKFTKHDMLSTKKAKSEAEKQFEEAIRSTDKKEFQISTPNTLDFLEDIIYK